MDLSKLKNKALEYIRKYKFVALILLLGVFMLLFPTGRTSKEHSDKAPQTITKQEHISIDDLTAILESIKGAGRVKVLLSLENSEQTNYQQDTDSGNTSGLRQTTVTVTDAERNETGLICKTFAPVYRGAIVVCDGADNPAVQLSIVNAVSNITGLGTNQISVLKIK